MSRSSNWPRNIRDFASQPADTRERVPFRAEPDEMRHHKQWCLDNNCTMQEAMTRAMRSLTGFGAKTPRRQDAMAPEGSSSCNSVFDRSSKTDQTTTTTTTVAPRRHDARASEPMLPLGPVAVVNGSRFSLEDNLEYAWAAHEKDGSVKWPERFAAANLKSGKYDVMIQQWKDGKTREPLPDLRECRNPRCKKAFRPKPGESVVYCGPGCFGQ